jgi:hypothetical protein
MEAVVKVGDTPPDMQEGLNAFENLSTPFIFFLH